MRNKDKAGRGVKEYWAKRHASGISDHQACVNKISVEEYNAMKEKSYPLCACGCGGRVNRVGRNILFKHFANTVRTNMRVIKKCLHCQKEFTVAENTGSPSLLLQILPDEIQRTGKRYTERMARICPICGSGYEISVNDLETGRRVTCSFACGIEQREEASL